MKKRVVVETAIGAGGLLLSTFGVLLSVRGLELLGLVLTAVGFGMLVSTALAIYFN
jgi:hypothetical protein